MPEARIRGHRKLPQTEAARSAWVPPHCEGRGAGASRETQEGAGGRKVSSPLPAHQSPVWSGSPRTPSLESSSPQRPDGAEAGANLEAEATSFLSREALELRMQGREAWTLTVLGQGGKQGRPRPDHITTFSARTYIRAK